MNERIRTFMEDCFDISIDGRGREECTADYAGIERFSDLIVRECGTVINSENYREHSKGWNDAIEWADGMIKEHFEIEP